jgi:Family of unknown function (DUF5397)
MKTLARTADDLIGTFRTFGEFGPLYQVVGKIDDTKVHILVIPTGEELDYLVERALTDPEAD